MKRREAVGMAAGSASSEGHRVRCDACGYDLSGLATDARCPECGSFARATRGKSARSVREMRLEDAPRGYLTVVMYGFLLCGLGALGRGIVSCAAGYGFLDMLTAGQVVMLVGGLAIAWAAGGWLITGPRPSGTVVGAAWDRHREWRVLRWTVRGSAALGVVSAITLVVYTTGGPYWVMIPWALAEVVFATVCCWYAARIAEWAQDDGLASRLRAAAWMIGGGELGVGLVIAQPWVGVFPLIWLIVILVASAVIGSIMASIGMLQGANMVRWAIRVARERRASEARIRARVAQGSGPEGGAGMAEGSDRWAERPDRVVSRQEQERNPEPVGPQGPMPGKTTVIERASDAGYGLEGEGESPAG